MGRKARQQPRDLAYKLKFIRDLLSLTQDAMWVELSHPRIPSEEDTRVGRGSISDYEQGRRVPSLLEMLAYVKTVKRNSRFEIKVDDLIDDDVKISHIFLK